MPTDFDSKTIASALIGLVFALVVWIYKADRAAHKQQLRETHERLQRIIDDHDLRLRALEAQRTDIALLFDRFGALDKKVDAVVAALDALSREIRSIKTA